MLDDLQFEVQWHELWQTKRSWQYGQIVCQPLSTCMQVEWWHWPPVLSVPGRRWPSCALWWEELAWSGAQHSTLQLDMLRMFLREGWERVESSLPPSPQSYQIPSHLLSPLWEWHEAPEAMLNGTVITCSDQLNPLSISFTTAGDP